MAGKGSRSGRRKGEPEKSGSRAPALCKGEECESRSAFCDLVDKSPVQVYVADLDTYEIIFANKVVRDTYGTPSPGMRCHELFEGRSTPCVNCTNPIIRSTRMPHTWDYYDRKTKRHYQAVAQIVRWHDGREVRFETAMDITDQKLTESSLEMSEAKYRSFIENSTLGFYILDSKGNVTYLNKVAASICGRKPDPAKGEKLNLSDLFSPEDLERAQAVLGALAGGQDVIRPGVYDIKRPNGELRTIEVQTFPITRDGEVEGFHGTIVDVTDKMKAERDLNEKTKMLDAVFNNASDGIFVVNEDLTYVMINPASGRILGHDPAAWIGKKAGTFKHPEDAKCAAAAILRIVSGEPESSCEVRVQASDGVYHLLHIRYNPMFLGEEFHILGMVTDITEQKMAEEALIASEDKYRSLFENSPEAILILGDEGKIIESNNATYALFEMDIRKVNGRRIDELGILDPAQSEFYRSWFIAMTQGREMNNRDMELIFGDGRSKWVEIIPSMITRAGEFYGVQMIARDITDRKLKDIEMRRKLLRFDIDHGNVYLSKEPRASRTLEAFKELLMVGHEGLALSREPEADDTDLNNYMYNHVTVSEAGNGSNVKPEYKAIRQLVANLPRKHIIHIDCIEYLISRIGAQKAIALVQYLKDLAAAKGFVVLISIDPSAVTEKDLRLIEMECLEIVPCQSLTRLSEKLLEILQYIDEMNREGVMPSYSDISEHFGISKPTARDRIGRLHDLGTVKEKPRGRMKVLELTKTGKNYLVV